MYPIYIDAKASLKHRRVSKQLAVPWPQAKLMAIQCNRLGLRAHIEVSLTFLKLDYNLLSL